MSAGVNSCPDLSKPVAPVGRTAESEVARGDNTLLELDVPFCTAC